MANDMKPTPPEAFGVARFADLLFSRDPIVGETPGSFEVFREGLIRSLAPVTPYEYVIAENLVDIEWKLLQNRKMFEAGLRRVISNVIRQAVVEQKRAEYLERCEAADFGSLPEAELPVFDEEAAERSARDLAARAISQDPDIAMLAHEELADLGMEPIELMGKAYRTQAPTLLHHRAQVEQLEERRRAVKKDYDALVKTRPLEGRASAP